MILGNAMAGEKHYLTALRIYFPEFADELERAPTFAALPARGPRQASSRRCTQGSASGSPDITEDTMPGELANIIAGRVANLFDFHGPNFIADAACASAMAAMSAAVEGLVDGDFDARDHRRHRPQHGRVDVRQVLQDRRAVGDRARDPTPTAPTAS